MRTSGWFHRHPLAAWLLGLTGGAVAVEASLLLYYLNSWLTLPY